jgi:hemerythrin
MEYVTWTPELSVGIGEIDAQHEHFIGIINKAKEAVDAGAPRAATGEVVGELVSYTRYHFETEEKYFEKFGYPYADEHKKEHAELLSKVLVLSDKFESGETIAPQLLAFLKEWLADHLKKHDQKYAKYFKKMGYI